MNTRYVMGSTMRMAGLALCALAVFTWVFFGAFAREPGREITLQQSVHSIWEEADGPIVALDIQRSWTWGPEPLAQTTEFYNASPDGKRTLVYFDKARLDIVDMNADRSSPWFVTGALLVSEMLSGEIQLDADETVSRPVPDIALTGDMDQADPITYEVLAEHSMFKEEAESDDNEDVEPADSEEAEPVENAVGSELTAVLQATGTVDADGMAGSGVFVSEYSDTTGYNIAEPFSNWADSMSYPDLYLLGHPVSEPYWIQTEVLGTPKMVLVQAFERRVLTYTPDNPVEWMVESANVGQHYRLWRGLEQPIDPSLVPLASLASFGEELVQAAVNNGLDPYMLVAISEVVSGGDALHESSTGSGLLNLSGTDVDLDPQENANAGAKIMRTVTPVASAPDWEVILTAFYGDDELVDETLEVYDELFERYTAELMVMSDDTVDPQSFGGPLSSGPVAYYDPSYTTDWWEWALTYYDGMGLVAPGWANDPSGYYCVRPGYLPGERLRVNANGRTIDCTVGDMVADRDLGNWLSKWSIEMNWPMFVALGLDQNNMASVEYPGNTPKPPPPVTVVPQSPSTQPPVPPAPGGPSNPDPIGPQAPSVSPEAPQQPVPPPPPVVAPAPPMSEPVPTPEPEPAPAPPVVEPAPPVVEPAPAPPVVEPAPPAPPSSDGGGGSADPLPPSR